MKTSEAEIREIKSCEALRLTAYPDATGAWTIGYGQTLGVKKGATITPEEADERLRARLCLIEFHINSHVKAPLSQNQFDSLVEFEYRRRLAEHAGLRDKAA